MFPGVSKYSAVCEPLGDVLGPANTLLRFELDLMRFGTKERLSGFDKIICIYDDETVATILGGGPTVPKKIELCEEDGYPATTHHGLGFNFEVPLPDLGERIYEFRDIQFQESIFVPKVYWAKGRPLNTAKPNFLCVLTCADLLR